MNDWQIGDMALCIDASAPRDVCGNGGIEAKREYIANLIEGRIYKVTQIVTCSCGEHVGLGCHADRAGGSSDRFRKIAPDKHEACEAEFVTLLKRRKVAA